MGRVAYCRAVAGSSFLIAMGGAMVLKTMFFDLPVMLFIAFIFGVGSVVTVCSSFICHMLMTGNKMTFLLLSFFKNVAVSGIMCFSIFTYAASLKNGIYDAHFVEMIKWMTWTVIIPFCLVATYKDYQSLYIGLICAKNQKPTV